MQVVLRVQVAHACRHIVHQRQPLPPGQRALGGRVATGGLGCQGQGGRLQSTIVEDG